MPTPKTTKAGHTPDTINVDIWILSLQKAIDEVSDARGPSIDTLIAVRDAIKTRAALIAAAPELLKELKLLVKITTNLLDSNLVCRDAITAIAKAEQTQ